MPNSHAPCSPAFKDEAVRLVLSGDKSITAIALGRPLGSMGVSDPTLRSWVRQAETDAGSRDGLTMSERIELARLRREVRVLKQGRDTVKKAAARESDAIRSGVRVWCRCCSAVATARMH